MSDQHEDDLVTRLQAFRPEAELIHRAATRITDLTRQLAQREAAFETLRPVAVDVCWFLRNQGNHALADSFGRALIPLDPHIAALNPEQTKS